MPWPQLLYVIPIYICSIIFCEFFLFNFLYSCSLHPFACTYIHMCVHKYELVCLHTYMLSNLFILVCVINISKIAPKELYFAFNATYYYNNFFTMMSCKLLLLVILPTVHLIYSHILSKTFWYVIYNSLSLNFLMLLHNYIVLNFPVQTHRLTYRRNTACNFCNSVPNHSTIKVMLRKKNCYVLYIFLVLTDMEITFKYG